tara:strand:- start:598 stop:1470 length:873 start_codon:yes stop_codon:yes gene_type:complete
MATFKGISSVIEQAPERAWNSITGYTTTRIYVGNKIKVEQFSSGSINDASGASVVAGYSNASISYDGPTATLRLTYSGTNFGATSSSTSNLQPSASDIAGATLSNIWYLEGNDLEKDLFHLENMQAIFKNTTNTNLSAFRKDWDIATSDRTNPDDVPFVDATRYTGTVNGMNAAAQAAYVKNIYISALRGTEFFTVSQYVLRNIKVVPPTTNQSPEHANVGSQFTNALMTATSGNGQSVPAVMLSGISSGFWLKRTPSVEQTTEGNYQITKEFWYSEDYDTNIYGTAISS